MSAFGGIADMAQREKIEAIFVLYSSRRHIS